MSSRLDGVGRGLELSMRRRLMVGARGGLIPLRAVEMSPWRVFGWSA